MNLTAAKLRAQMRELQGVPAFRANHYIPTGQAFIVRSSLVGGPVPRELENTIFLSEADYRRIFEGRP